MLYALVRILGIQVEGLPVEDHRCSALVLVGPAPDLHHGFHVGNDQLGVFLAHHVGAGDDGGGVGNLHGPVRVPRQILDHLDLARRLLQVLEDLALGVDGIDSAFQQRRLQGTESQVVLVVTAHP